MTMTACTVTVASDGTRAGTGLAQAIALAVADRVAQVLAGESGGAR